MTDNEYNKKEVLQCRSCHSTFHQSDVKEVKTERCGLIINEKICPYCGSRTYGLIYYQVSEFDLLYKNFYHRNTDKKLRKALDKIVEDILEEDKVKVRKKRFVKEVNAERMAMA